MLREGMIGLAMLVVTGMAFRTANADEAPPKDNKGFSTTKTEIVDLGPEIPGMEGRQLRLRVLKIEPGGHIGLHSHKDRPSVVYFLEGTDTVSAEDGTKKPFMQATRRQHGRTRHTGT